MDVYIVCPGEIVAYNHTRYNCNKHVSRRDGTRPESGTDPAVNSRSSSPRRGYFASATHTAPLFSYRSTPVETKGAPIAPALISSHSGALAPVPATCVARRRSQRRIDPLTEGQKDCHFVPPPLCSRGTNERRAVSRFWILERQVHQTGEARLIKPSVAIAVGRGRPKGVAGAGL